MLEPNGAHELAKSGGLTERLGKVPPQDVVHYVGAAALALNERYRESAECMDAATALEPKNPVVWLLKARFYSYAPDKQPGIDACRRALELDPDLDAAHTLLDELQGRVKRQ